MTATGIKLQVFPLSDRWKLQALRCWGKQILQTAVSVYALFLLIMLLHVREQSLQVSQLKENSLKRSRKQKPGQGMSVQRDVQEKGH